MKKVGRLLFFTLLFVCALAVVFQLGVAQERNQGVRPQRPTAGAGQEKSQMTPAEKLAGWKSQKVTILGTQPLRCPMARGSRVFFHALGSEDKEFLPYDKYAGQTGVIVEATMGSYQPEVVVQLDKTGEKIVSKGEDGLAYQSELETAKSLIGRSLWSRGAQSLTLKDSLCLEIGKRNTLELKNLQRVTIKAVELGHHLQPIYLLLKTEDGQEGWLTGWDGYDNFDSKFHVAQNRGVQNRYYTYRFYAEDPHKLHSDWKDPVWKLIEDSQVAIGMTEEMAKMACGRDMRTTGFVLAGDESSPIYLCNYKKFLVEKGKVTKYVE